jgi:hypothetical protein
MDLGAACAVLVPNSPCTLPARATVRLEAAVRDSSERRDRALPSTGASSIVDMRLLEVVDAADSARRRRPSREAEVAEP